MGLEGEAMHLKKAVEVKGKASEAMVTGKERMHSENTESSVGSGEPVELTSHLQTSL